MIYDYQCQDCGEFFEVQATLAQKEAGLQPRCPKCDSNKTVQSFRSLSIIASANKSSSSGNFSPPGCGPNFGAGCC